MSTAPLSESQDVDIDLPDDRDYETQAMAELDASLVKAIRAADDAEHDYLSQLLRNELKSLYYESRSGV